MGDPAAYRRGCKQRPGLAINEFMWHLAAPCVVPKLEFIQAFSFPTEAPSSFELPDSGVLELTFAANRPVLPPAWRDGHVEAAIQKARGMADKNAKTSDVPKVSCCMLDIVNWHAKRTSGAAVDPAVAGYAPITLGESLVTG